MMEKKKATTSPIIWLMILGLAILGAAFAVVLEDDSFTVERRLCMIVLCSMVMLYAAYHASYSAYISEDGISCSFLGKNILEYRWGELYDVAVINDYRLSVRHSTRIVAISKGCPLFDKKKWFGLQYVFRFRKQVIWLDNTKQNREYIQRFFGQIADRR